MPEPVWNCHSCAPVSASKAMNSPVSFPVKTNPPPVDSVADQICRSATLSTGGGLVFTGKETGEFIALDADTGAQLWQFQTGSGINAQPVTYTHKGRQYVSVLSGIGGLYWNINREALKNVPQGGSVWTF